MRLTYVTIGVCKYFCVGVIVVMCDCSASDNKWLLSCYRMV